jgi:hypothetical protein
MPFSAAATYTLLLHSRVVVFVAENERFAMPERGGVRKGEGGSAHRFAL